MRFSNAMTTVVVRTGYEQQVNRRTVVRSQSILPDLIIEKAKSGGR
jgi:hypothetical protein